MGKLIFIVGGARSGKSSLAMKLAVASKKKVAFIATATADNDPEMEERINHHRRQRPVDWLVVEEPLKVSQTLLKLKKKIKVVIIDCLTLLLNNWHAENNKDILKRVEDLTRTIKKTKLTVIIVANEVGLGVHPVSQAGRLFRDLAGWANQMVARSAAEVYFMAAGIPMKIKG